MGHFLRVSSVITVVSLAASAQVNVLTANYGNDRTNANLNETILTTANVAPGSFGKLGSFPVDGQVYAQPLYAASVEVSGSGTHNILFVATQHNTVFAYDADSAAAPNLLWQVNLGPSVPSSTFGDYGDIAPEIGILSTPAIDLTRGVLYVVSDTLANGNPLFQLHALSIATGAEMLNGPVVISGSVAGTGAASVNGALAFDPYWHIQRPGLLLANGNVYISFGSHGDAGPWHGWLFTFSAANLSAAPAIFNVSPNGVGGSIWQSGRGMAADSSGNLYAVAGNGDYDGVANFSQSFLKFSGAAPAISDWYTSPDWEFLSDNDYDLSAGPVLLPGTHTIVAGDKAGQLYLVNGDSMGHGTGGTAQTFSATPSGGIFTMALWNRTGGAYVYIPQLNGSFECFSISGGSIGTTPTSVSLSTGTDPYEGIAVSANGSASGTGILWAVTDDNTKVNLPGTLHAYDATNLATEIWNSDMSGGSDALGTYAKFASPTIVNGKVYVPTWSNAVVVYGLLSTGGQGSGAPAIASVVNSASYAVGAVSPGELVTLFGSNLGPTPPAGMQFDSTGAVATLIGGAEVLFDGVPAPLLFASATQVNAIVPFELANPTTQVQVIFAGQTSTAISLQVAPATPAGFTSDGSGTGQLAALNQDYTVNSAGNPAAQGSIVTLYGDGAGALSPSVPDGSVVTAGNLPHTVLPVTVLVNGIAANVLYAGGSPQDVAGVLQVNFQLPLGVPSGPAIPVVLQAGTTASKQTVSIAVE